MNEDKMSSSDVPQKFTDWLLSMGCPPYKIPSSDKMSQMCRGQYYMVWRSLMKHVEPKDVIRRKRMQVFCEDVLRYRQAHIHDNSALMPPELLAWNKLHELKTAVKDTEARVSENRRNLTNTIDKVSIRLSERNLTKTQVKNDERRVWLLRRAAEDLKCHKERLSQVRSIAESLSRTSEDSSDVQNKLEKCVALLSKRAASPRKGAGLSMSCVNHMGTSSLMSTTSDNEQTNPAEDQPTIPSRLLNQLDVLNECSAQSIWTHLNERVSALVHSLSADNCTVIDAEEEPKGVTPQFIVTHTSFLIYRLFQDQFMYRVQTDQMQRDIVASKINNLNLTEQGCELLLLRCDVVKAVKKLNFLRTMLKSLRTCSGPFHTDHDLCQYAPGEKSIAQVDRDIFNIKENLKKLVQTMIKTESKIKRAKEKIDALYMGFQTDADDYEKYLDMDLDLPEDSIASICKFYKEYQEKRGAADLSMNLDVSENSFTDALDNATEPTFTDELKLYLNKFNLEDNRKLVLENGEIIWIFESLKSSVSKLHKECVSENVSCNLICPSLSLSSNLNRLVDNINEKSALNDFVQTLEVSRKSFNIDANIDQYKAEEYQRVDKMKKQLHENILSLQKTNTLLAASQDNLKLWSENVWRNYMSTNRTVDSKGCKEYESIYLGYLNPTE